MRRPLFGALLGLALALGLGLTLAERDLPASVLEARYANSASRFLNLSRGIRAHVRDQGNRAGPPLVLIHGTNVSLHTWEPWAARLGDAFRIITFDLPGHGLTGAVADEDYDVPAMLAFIDEVTRALGLERFNLGGSSYGGGLAWRYALAHPERVERLILIDSTGYPREAPLPLPFRLVRVPGFGRITRYVSPRLVFELTLREIFFNHERTTPEMTDLYHDLALREGTRRANWVRLNLPPDTGATRALMSTLRMPTLVMWGQHDPWVPVSDARLFHQDIPGSVLRIYERSAHVPMEDEPDASAADVRAFLSGTLAAQ
jgi:pimeloyl-ACP methyl ester carboxylesterase